MTTNTNMPTDSSVVYEEIEDMLQSTFDLISVPRLETRYREKYNRSLECKSLGFKSVDELLEKMRSKGMVLFYEHPQTCEKYVTYGRTKSSKIQEEIVDMLVSSYEGGISVSCLERRYREKYKRSLDCKSLGFNTIEELLEKMRFEGMVLLFEDPQTCEKYVKCARVPTKSSKIQDMPTGSSGVYEEIVDMLVSSYEGISVSRLERRYREKYKRSLDCKSLGFYSVEELLEKMRCEGMVLFFEHPQTCEKYVSYARTKSSKIQDMPTIQDDLMYFYDRIQYVVSVHVEGATMSQIEETYHHYFGSLPDYGSLGVEHIKGLIDNMKAKGWVLVYEEPKSKEELVMCAQELKHDDGLTGPDNLCQELNLVAGSQGEKVIKPSKILCLRKRKIFI